MVGRPLYCYAGGRTRPEHGLEQRAPDERRARRAAHAAGHRRYVRRRTGLPHPLLRLRRTEGADHPRADGLVRRLRIRATRGAGGRTKPPAGRAARPARRRRRDGGRDPRLRLLQAVLHSGRLYPPLADASRLRRRTTTVGGCSSNRASRATRRSTAAFTGSFSTTASRAAGKRPAAPAVRLRTNAKRRTQTSDGGILPSNASPSLLLPFKKAAQFMRCLFPFASAAPVLRPHVDAAARRAQPHLAAAGFVRPEPPRCPRSTTR